MINIKEIANYKDYGKVLCLSNGEIEAYVTLDVGPRIIRFGFIGGQNFMRDERSSFEPKCDEEFQSFFGKGKRWENLGGHRIWLSPEAYPDTYYPDNEPIKYEICENGAIFTPAPETENGVQKQMEVTFPENSTDMQVTMRAENISDSDKKFSIWGLTVSALGGDLIIPTNTVDTGLLHNRSISLWPYTDMSDKRIYWGKNYVTLHQDESVPEPLKLGFDLNCAKAHYVLNGEVFTKQYETLHPTAEYPDGGCSFETYDCGNFIEVESLGELKTVKPGETSVLTENWSLKKLPTEVNFRDCDSIDNMLKKL